MEPTVKTYVKATLTLSLLLLTSLTISGVTSAQNETFSLQAQLTICATCHNADGNALLSNTPKLAGQHPKYLIKQLHAFKQADKGGRENPIMYGLVQNLTDTEIRDIASYYAAYPITIGVTQSSLLTLGQQLYRGGDRTRGVPACTACHGPQGEGNELAGFPVLHGQNAEYTTMQLKAFRDGKRTNDPNRMMRDIASQLTDQDIDALASYIAGLH